MTQLDVALTPLTLDGEGVRLRPWLPTDVEAVFRECQDQAIQRWTLVPSPYRHEDAEEFVNGSDERWEKGVASFAVVDPGTDELIGSMGFVTRPEIGVAEIGYWIAAGVRGQGVAARGVRLLCEWGFAEVGLTRIQWEAEVGNVASRMVAESCGFTIEGTLRRGLRSRDDTVDGWIGSLLPGEPMERSRPRLVSAVPVTVSNGEGDTHMLLRVPDVSEADWVLDAYRDPEIALWNPADVIDLASAQRWIAGRADWTADDHASFLIVLGRETPTLVGSVSLHKMDAENLTASIGYWTHPDFRRRGCASQAVRLASNWGMARLGLKRIELIHAVDNVGSCGVAERAGFEMEGTARCAQRYGDGLWHDEHIHARVAQ